MVHAPGERPPARMRWRAAWIAVLAVSTIPITAALRACAASGGPAARDASSELGSTSSVRGDALPDRGARDVPASAASSREPILPHPRGTISGTLAGVDGRPVDGRELHFRLARGAGGALLGSGREDGTYRFVGLPLGSWSVRVAGAGLHAAEAELELSEDRPHAVHDFVLERERVVFWEATTADGAPLDLALRAHGAAIGTLLSFASVSVPTAAGDGSVRVRSISRAARGAGAEALALARGDDAGLVVRLGAHVLCAWPVPPDVTDVRIEVDARALLARAARLSLEVVADEDGAPLEGARLELAVAGLPARVAFSAHDGRARLEALPPGPATLRVRAAGRERFARELTLAPVAELDLGILRLARGAVADLDVTDALGRPASMRLALSRAHGGGWMDLALEPGEESDSAGRARLEGLGPGRYRVCAVPAALGCVEFEVGPGAPAPPVLRLAAP